jgi:hypothetical protein
MDTTIAQEALADKELYQAIIEHRRKFIGIKGFDYYTLIPQTISFVPPSEVISFWKCNLQSIQVSGCTNFRRTPVDSGGGLRKRFLLYQQ